MSKLGLEEAWMIQLVKL